MPLIQRSPFAVGVDGSSWQDGMFSFVLLDTRDGSFMAARDPIGVTPLYIGHGRDGSVWFASEVRTFLGSIQVSVGRVASN